MAKTPSTQDEAALAAAAAAAEAAAAAAAASAPTVTTTSARAVKGTYHNPFTKVTFVQGEQIDNAVIDSWLQSQVDAGLIELV